jgi:hypothetical protein
MRILGAALITASQQDRLADGAILNIPRTAVYDSAAKRALLRDRFWVREPYIELSPAKYNCPQHIYAVIPGHSPRNLVVPPEIKPFFEVCKKARCNGSDMTRTQSRAQLEIMRIMADGKGFECRVHMTAVGKVAA